MNTKPLVTLTAVALSSLACLGEDTNQRRYSNVPSPGSSTPPPTTSREGDYSDYEERQRTRESFVFVTAERPGDVDPSRRTEWAPSSVIDSIELVTDDSCCADFDDDSHGLTDNALGSLFGFFEQSLQDGVDDSIGNGELVVLFEHEGLDVSGGSFTMNVLRGVPSGRFVDSNTSDEYTFQPDPDGSNPYVIDPREVDDSDAASHTITASYEDGVLTASARKLRLPFDLWNTSVDIDLHHVRITARVDLEDTTGGIRLEEGTIGGVVYGLDLYDTINDFVTLQCDCLGIEGDMITYPRRSGVIVAECLHDFEPDHVRELCFETSTEPNMGCLIAPTFYCDNASGFVFALDQYTDEPQRNCLESEGVDAVDCDGISLGLRFTAAGAVIEGIDAP